MKKFALTTMVALALVLTFTQCKKTEKPAAEEGVFVTLRATYGQSEDRTDFDPNPNNENNFVWTNGVTEYVYVGGSQHEGCMGVLSGTGTGTGSMNFTGSLTDMPEDGEELYFFYLGKGTTSALTTLDFSVQDGTIGNLTEKHIAIGKTTFNGDYGFNVTFDMAVSFAYFNTSEFGDETVSLYGDEVYSKATVNFNNGTITGSEKDNISIGQGASGAYVALIPSTTSQTTLEFDSDTKTGSIDFLRGIQAGRYYCKNGDALEIVVNASVPQGALKGKFTINSSGNQVYFSKGNLQASTEDGGTNWSWGFASNQYDYIGDAIANTSISGGGIVSSNGTVDLFGWSSNKDQYYGINNASNPASYGGRSYRNWGAKIADGWSTLAFNEWIYVFNDRSASTVNGVDNARYCKATVNGVAGIVVFPDSYTHPVGVTEPSNINVMDADYGGNVWSSANFAKMQQKGGVFLPAAGSRESTTVSNVNTKGHYWSKSSNGNLYALELDFDNIQATDPTHYPSASRHYGYSVRLVYPVE